MTGSNDERTTGKGMAIEGVAMPEFLSREDMPQESWRVTQGAPVRGDAHTQIDSRTMRVPFGNTATARVIRAHEMIHAKVSPKTCPDQIAYKGTVIGSEAIRAAEEVRVNHLVKSAGFDINDLTDGSERTTGKAIGEMGIAAGWNHAVTFGAGMIGTKALTAFIGGIASVDKTFGAAIRKAMTDLRKTHKDLSRRYATSTIASTVGDNYETGDDGIGDGPRGFVRYTLPLARKIQRLCVDPTEDSTEADIESMVKSRVESKGGESWAAPIIDKSIALTKHVDGRIGRKRIASNVGRVPRHLERLLTDPERRVFDRRSRGKGGVVLIDQSGSMHLSTEDIDRMIAAAPGCVIIGYSHRPGSVGIPNIWIIADRGKVAESIPHGNGGNGVDGPAIRFALTHRRTGEPLIWVCDGHVTDSKDNWSAALTDECAELVAKHRIHMVENADEAVESLRKAATARVGTRAIGNIKHSQGWATAVENGLVSPDGDERDEY